METKTVKDGFWIELVALDRMITRAIEIGEINEKVRNGILPEYISQTDAKRQYGKEKIIKWLESGRLKEHLVKNMSHFSNINLAMLNITE